MKSLNDIKIQIFADGADRAGILELYAKPYIKGLTTNPILIKKAGIRDYEAFAKDILKTVTAKPISFEVFTDDFTDNEAAGAQDLRPCQERLYKDSDHEFARRILASLDQGTREAGREASHIPDQKWALTFGINVTGSYLVADEAAMTWEKQGLHGTLVLTTSANAIVAKKGSLAYDTSKAAANHLVRELAVELAPLIRVNGVSPATVAQGSAMFLRERVIGSRAKYDIAYREDEPTESLRAKLAQFYADRTLTKVPITPIDQAEAFFLLVGERLSKTTGQVITVDGGLHEAFLR